MLLDGRHRIIENENRLGDELQNEKMNILQERLSDIDYTRIQYNREKARLKSIQKQRDLIVSSIAAERGIVIGKEIEALQQSVYAQRGWEPLQDVDETEAGLNYIEAKRNLDEVLKHGRDGYYDFERIKDPKTGLNDEQIRKELDELNQ